MEKEGRLDLGMATPLPPPKVVQDFKIDKTVSKRHTLSCLFAASSHEAHKGSPDDLARYLEDVKTNEQESPAKYLLKILVG